MPVDLSRTGIDPDDPSLQPLVVDPAETLRAALGGFVTQRGGEYFFAPSLSFLKGLHAAG